MLRQTASALGWHFPYLLAVALYVLRTFPLLAATLPVVVKVKSRSCDHCQTTEYSTLTLMLTSTILCGSLCLEQFGKKLGSICLERGARNKPPKIDYPVTYNSLVIRITTERILNCLGMPIDGGTHTLTLDTRTHFRFGWISFFRDSSCSGSLLFVWLLVC